MLFDEQHRNAGLERNPVAGPAQEGAIRLGNRIERAAARVEVRGIERVEQRDRRAGRRGPAEVVQHPGRLGKRELGAGQSLDEVAAAHVVGQLHARQHLVEDAPRRHRRIELCEFASHDAVAIKQSPGR